MLVTASVDGAHLINEVPRYVSLTEQEDLRTQIVGHIVEMLDGFLLATMMFVFSYGLYELFVSRLDAADGSSIAPRVLVVRTFEDLKDRLASVVILILVVTFFQHAVRLTVRSPFDILYLSAAILLVAGALYLMGRRHALEERLLPADESGRGPEHGASVPPVVGVTGLSPRT